MHSLPVLEQEVGAIAACDADSGSGKHAAAVAQAGWGLGGTGPVLKTQTIVSIRRLITLIVRKGMPRSILPMYSGSEWGVVGYFL